MEKTDKQINEEYAALRGDFKPVFGNDTHINIARTSGDITKMEQELSKKEAASKGAENLRQEIIAKKKNVIFWLKGK